MNKFLYAALLIGLTATTSVSAKQSFGKIGPDNVSTDIQNVIGDMNEYEGWVQNLQQEVQNNLQDYKTKLTALVSEYTTEIGNLNASLSDPVLSDTLNCNSNSTINCTTQNVQKLQNYITQATTIRDSQLPLATDLQNDVASSDIVAAISGAYSAIQALNSKLSLISQNFESFRQNIENAQNMVGTIEGGN